MIIASEVIARAGRILSDNTKVRWTEAELVEYCKDAVRNIVLARPDAYSITRWFVLKPGDTRQVVGNVAGKDNIDFGSAIFEPTTRLLRVTRNGSTGAFYPIREASRVALDSELPGWHVPVQSAVGYRVQHFVYDNIAPYIFYVYPCPPTTLQNHQVEIVHSGLPDLTGTGPSLNLGLPAQYMSPLLDWALYRAFSKDAEYGGNMDRANHHLAAFWTTLDGTQKSGFLASTPQAATPLPAAANWRRSGG